MTSEHTPIEHWKINRDEGLLMIYDGRNLGSDRNESCVIAFYDEDSEEYIDWLKDGAEREANLQLVWQSVHYHARLIEALRAMVEEFKPATNDPEDEERYTPQGLKALDVASGLLADIDAEAKR